MSNINQKVLIGVILLFTTVICISSGIYAATAEISGSDLTLVSGESKTFTVSVKDSNNNPLDGQLVVLKMSNSIKTLDIKLAHTDSYGLANFKVTAPSSSGIYTLSYELDTFDSKGSLNQHYGSGSNTLIVKEVLIGTAIKPSSAPNSNNADSASKVATQSNNYRVGDKEVFHKKVSKYTHNTKELFKKKNVATGKTKKIGNYKYRVFKVYSFYKNYKHFANYNQYKVYMLTGDGNFHYVGLNNKKMPKTISSSPVTKKFVGTTKKCIGTKLVREK